MAKPKYDYDGVEFYSKIQDYATQGLNDAEIADYLEIDEHVFNKMKLGKYEGWNKEENERRSALISQVLARGRKRIIGALRGTYIRAALGKIKPRSKTIKYIEERCECGGDPNCEICGGTGRVVRSDKWITLETEAESAPNMQAIATLLYHHDPEWRKIERRQDEDAKDVPEDVERGINIEDWINQELKAKDDMAETETDNDDTNG